MPSFTSRAVDAGSEFGVNELSGVTLGEQYNFAVVVANCRF